MAGGYFGTDTHLAVVSPALLLDVDFVPFDGERHGLETGGESCLCLELGPPGSASNGRIAAIWDSCRR